MILFLNQFKSLLVLILIFAAVISIVSREWIDATYRTKYRRYSAVRCPHGDPEGASGNHQTGATLDRRLVQ